MCSSDLKVRSEILRKKEKGVSNMKSKFLNPKTILIAGIVCVLTTVTCVAATDLFRVVWKFITIN